MPVVNCRFATRRNADGKIKEYEFDEFFVEDDPIPPGRWKVWYKTRYQGGEIDYWVVLPKNKDHFMRQQEVLDRDLTCDAVGMTCERLVSRKRSDGYPEGVAIERLATEPREPSLTRLAIEVERSKAILLGREPRQLVSVTCIGRHPA